MQPGSPARGSHPTLSVRGRQLADAPIRHPRNHPKPALVLALAEGFREEQENPEQQENKNDRH